MKFCGADLERPHDTSSCLSCLELGSMGPHFQCKRTLGNAIQLNIQNEELWALVSGCQFVKTHSRAMAKLFGTFLFIRMIKM